MSKEEFLKSLGEHIKQLREKKGFSAAEFARRTEMERSHIARIETGQTNPTSTTLKTLCDGLDIELEEFFAGFKKG